MIGFSVCIPSLAVRQRRPSGITAPRLASPVSGDLIANAVVAVEDDNATNMIMRSGRSVLVMVVKGTSATLSVEKAGYDDQDIVAVSIDGAAAVTASRTGTIVTLFSGLADEEHTVAVSLAAGYSTCEINKLDTNCLVISGDNPYALIPQYRADAGDPDYQTAAILDDAEPGWAPIYIPGATQNQCNQNLPSVAFEGVFSELFIAGSVKANTIGGVPAGAVVSVDGAWPETVPFYDLGMGRFVCPPGHHQYKIWLREGDQFGHYLGVGAFEEISTTAINGQLHHYGHSIVEAKIGTGGTGAGGGLSDMMGLATYLNYMPNNLGVSGDTIATLWARVPPILADYTLGLNDVAVLDIGRNDGSDAMDAAEESDMGDMLDALVAAGYGRILVLGAMESGGWVPTGYNASLQSLVEARTEYSSDPTAAITSPTIFWVPRPVSAYNDSSIDFPDGTHPSPAGYLSMYELNKTWVAPFITGVA